MGTRNLTCIYADGEYRVAQYGQWDGYPEAAGVEILEALKKTTPENLLARVMSCVVLNDEELEERWIECGAKPESGLVSMEVSNKMTKKYPTLQRDMGYGIVKYLIETDYVVPIQLALDFYHDTLFCEFAYIIDLDNKFFEVHTGGNPIARFPLDKLPTEKEFLEKVKKDTKKGTTLRWLIPEPKNEKAEEKPKKEKTKKKQVSLSHEEIAVIVDALIEIDPSKADDQDTVNKLKKRLSKYIEKKTKK